MKPPRIVIPLLLAVCVSPWTGCGRSPLDDSADRSATIPRRIVSLTPALTEIMFALDLGQRVVGVTSYCDYPSEARQRAKVGGYVNPSVEAVLALEPDLVVISPNTGNKEAGLAIRRAGVHVAVVPADSLGDTYRAIEQVAGECGVLERGRELAQALRRGIEDAHARVSDLPPTRVLFSLQLDPIVAAGRGTLPAEVLELAGGLNVVGAEGYPRMGIETVIAEAPELIVQARMDDVEEDVEEKVLVFWRRWPSIPAVRDGRVHVINAAGALRPGSPRIADAVRLLSRVLHPEAWPPGADDGPAAPETGMQP